MASDFSKSIMELRYSWTKENGEKESWEEIAERVSDNVLASVPLSDYVKMEVRQAIKERKLIPGGRFLAQSGRGFHQTNNCFTLRAEDSREGWADLAKKATLALMTGGGIGVDYSSIRESGAPLKRTGGVSSGPIPLIKSINEIGRGVMAGGSRRSAIWAGLIWNHPDIEEFIKIKNWTPEVRAMKEKDFDFPATCDMTNVSVILDKKFFDAYYDEENPEHLLARKVYWDTIHRMLKTGEPGFSVNYNNPKESLRNAPVCGETMVLTDRGYKKVIDIVDTPTTVFTGKQYAKDVVFTKTQENAEIYRIKMSGGRIIRCEGNHEFFVETSKWVSKEKQTVVEKVKAKYLKEGDRLQISLPSIAYGLSEPLKDSYTLGYLYGDGSFSKAGKAEVTLCSEESKKCLPFLKTKLLSSITEETSRGCTRAYYKTDNYFVNRRKEVFPQEMFEASVEDKLSFIAGLWDADGNYNRKQFRLSSNHFDFLRDVGRLLESIGIVANVSKNGFSTYGQKQSYQLTVLSEYANDFQKLIPTVRVTSPDLSKYAPYRSAYIKVEDVTKEDKLEDVYCADVGVEEHSFVAEGVVISNCTEIVSDRDSDVCCLASVNLSKITDLAEFIKITELGVIFLLAGTEYSDVPYEGVREVREDYRRLGLGLMGIADWMAVRGIPYGPNPELADWLKQWQTVSDSSAKFWSGRFGMQAPVAVRAIAPNGSTSIAGGNTTGGIEPIFSKAYQRRYLTPDGWMKQYVVDSVAKRLHQQGVNLDLVDDAYSLSQDVERRIAFQAFVQQYVDNSISSTINLPPYGEKGNNDETAFGEILLKYLPELRGITVYPDGARGGQPLTPVDFNYALARENVVFEAHEECAGEGICGL